MTSTNRMIGVDVGGTFTDIFVLDEATGIAEVAKVPTTRPDQSGGFQQRGTVVNGYFLVIRLKMDLIMFHAKIPFIISSGFTITRLFRKIDKNCTLVEIVAE